jgi:ABC-type multidrug transport system ATPase subunit
MPKGSAEKARKLLSGLELAEYENTLPANLSGGQRRRVAIARALGFDSELLILDEPLKGLDMKLAAKTCELIKAQNKPIIVTSHSSFETSLWGGTVIHM